MAEPIEGPSLKPPVTGLIPAVTPAIDVPASDSPEDVRRAQAPRWVNGVAFMSVGCGGVEIVDCGTDAFAEVAADCTLVNIEAFQIVATVVHPRRGSDSVDLIQLARNKLEACTPKALEAELWSGTLHTTNPHLTMDDGAGDAEVTIVTPAGTGSVLKGLAELEEALGDCDCGGQGIIHMERRIATQLSGLGAIRRRLNPAGGDTYQLETLQGNLVVPGSGYPGTKPDGTAQAAGKSWMYATGMVAVRLAWPFTNPINREGLVEAFNRAANEITIQAMRFAVVAFDPNCCLIATEVTI